MDFDKIYNLPLYTKTELNIESPNPTSFNNIRFNAYCKIDKKDTTFTLNLYPEYSMSIEAKNITPKEITNIQEDSELEKQKALELNFVRHYRGKCNLCSKSEIDITLKIFSELDKNKVKYFVKKIGQFPPYDTKPDKETNDYLSEEDQSHFKKALICLSQAYGIASYAYLRRIIENVIKVL